MIKKISCFAVALFFLFSVFAAMPFSACAATVYPVDENSEFATDRKAIQYELDENKTVTLVKGKTYYLDGPLYIASNMKINATGATIICSKTAMYNIPEKTNYNSIKNFTVNGGTWKFSDEKGYQGSTIKVIHGQNITFKNMKIRHNNAKGHTIELVACKNVLIKGCDIAPLGKSDSKTEEAIQLDIATHTTAYFLENEPFKTKLSKKLQNGACCSDIRIINNVIKGNRGVVANYTDKENGKYLSKFHTDIVIKNNTITGLKGEGVALFNTISAQVKNNTIVSKAKGSDSYTVGLHIAAFGKNSELSKGKISVSKNIVKGGRQALLVYTHSSSKYGTVSVKDNKLYCRSGKNNALKILSNHCKKLSKKNNKTYKW